MERDDDDRRFVLQKAKRTRHVHDIMSLVTDGIVLAQEEGGRPTLEQMKGLFKRACRLVHEIEGDTIKERCLKKTKD